MATSRAVGFLLVLALSTTVISAVPDGPITARTPTTEAKTEETKGTVASLTPDSQNDHSKSSVVSTESETEKAGTQHSPSATPPRQEMVSFTVNLPLNAIEGDIEESFFNDMFNSFGSFFANLFAVDDVADDEEDSLNRDASTAMGPSSQVNNSTTGESAGSTGDKEHRAMDVELLDELDDSDFLSYLTSAYLQPLQGLMNSMMMGLDAYSPSLSVSSQQQKSFSGSSGSGGGIFDLISQIMNSTPESLMGPEVTTNITSENCIFEVDLGTVPETASIIVGVEGDAVFVEYSNTIGEKTGKEVDGEQTDVTSADTTTTALEETTTEVTETIKPNENYGTTPTSSGNNLRGSPAALAPTANVYSYERFVINPVCDYESVDAKAARVEDDKLLIKFPIKKDRAEEATTTKNTETPSTDKKGHESERTNYSSLPSSSEKTNVPSVSSSLGIKETGKKSEATTTEKPTVSSSQTEQVSDTSAQIRMAQKTQTPHRRILPMVAAAEF